MERIELSRSTPRIDFKLNDANSSLLLEKVYFKRSNENENTAAWADFALLVEFRVKLSYTIYDDSRNRFVEERTEEILIPLVPDIYQTEPVIQLNQRIDNRIFTVGVNSKQRHFNRLSLEVSNAETLSEDYTLELFVEKIKMMTNKQPVGAIEQRLMK